MTCGPNEIILVPINIHELAKAFVKGGIEVNADQMQAIAKGEDSESFIETLSEDFMTLFDMEVERTGSEALDEVYLDFFPAE